MPVVRGPFGDQVVPQEAPGQVQDGIPGPDRLQKNSLRDVQQVKNNLVYGGLWLVVPSLMSTFLSSPFTFISLSHAIFSLPPTLSLYLHSPSCLFLSLSLSIYPPKVLTHISLSLSSSLPLSLSSSLSLFLPPLTLSSSNTHFIFSSLFFCSSAPCMRLDNFSSTREAFWSIMLQDNFPFVAQVPRVIHLQGLQRALRVQGVHGEDQGARRSWPDQGEAPSRLWWTGLWGSQVVTSGIGLGTLVEYEHRYLEVMASNPLICLLFPIPCWVSLIRSSQEHSPWNDTSYLLPWTKQTVWAQNG